MREDLILLGPTQALVDDFGEIIYVGICRRVGEAASPRNPPGSTRKAQFESDLCTEQSRHPRHQPKGIYREVQRAKQSS